jgi:hypothetical protein
MTAESIPTSLMSSTYAAVPEISRGSSRRLIRLPTNLGITGIVVSSATDQAAFEARILVAAYCTALMMCR